MYTGVLIVLIKASLCKSNQLKNTYDRRKKWFSIKLIEAD